MFQASQWYKKKGQEKIKEERINEDMNTDNTFFPDTLKEINQDTRPYIFNNLTELRNFNPVPQPNFNIFTGNYQRNSNFQTELYIQQQRLYQNHQNSYFGRQYY